MRDVDACNLIKKILYYILNFLMFSTIFCGAVDTWSTLVGCSGSICVASLQYISNHSLAKYIANCNTCIYWSSPYLPDTLFDIFLPHLNISPFACKVCKNLYILPLITHITSAHSKRFTKSLSLLSLCFHSVSPCSPSLHPSFESQQAQVHAGHAAKTHLNPALLPTIIFLPWTVSTLLKYAQSC